MASVKLVVQFIGGCIDGHCIEDIDTISLPNIHFEFNGMWFRKTSAGVAVMSGGEPDKYWLSISVDVYELEKNNSCGHYTYRFIKRDSISKCAARTKSGNQCRNRAMPGYDYCTIHDRNNRNEPKSWDDYFNSEVRPSDDFLDNKKN